MRLREFVVVEKSLKEDEFGRHRRFDGVPQRLTEAFFRGLEDVKQGRVVSIDATLAEGRRLLAEYRAKKNKNMNEPHISQRKPPIP